MWVMSGWPIKYCDNCWQVQITEGQDEPRWIRCETDADAYQMSACLELMGVAMEGDREGDEIAQELESSASLFTKYGCDAEARWIMEHAKFARGLPSRLDDTWVD